MFKNIKYFSIPFLLGLTAILFLSCDGRERVHKTNAEVLKENKLFKSFSEIINYTPEQPVIIKTDTILSTGFNIKINYNSVEEVPVVIEKTIENNSTQKSIYKNFEAQITVSKENKFKKHFLLNKLVFSNIENSDFIEKAIMQHIWIDFEASTDKILYLNTAFHIPETENYRDFVISINQSGVVQIKEKHLKQNII